MKYETKDIEDCDLIEGIFDINEAWDERNGRVMYVMSIRLFDKPGFHLGKCKIVQED